MNENPTPPDDEISIRPSEPNKAEREYQAFLHLLPELLCAHKGQYVAIHNGQVVDVDFDDISLVKRVHARIGYVPIYVGLVAEQLPIVSVPHYRERQLGTLKGSVLYMAPDFDDIPEGFEG